MKLVWFGIFFFTVNWFLINQFYGYSGFMINQFRANIYWSVFPVSFTVRSVVVSINGCFKSNNINTSFVVMKNTCEMTVLDDNWYNQLFVLSPGGGTWHDWLWHDPGVRRSLPHHRALPVAHGGNAYEDSHGAPQRPHPSVPGALSHGQGGLLASLTRGHCCWLCRYQPSVTPWHIPLLCKTPLVSSANVIVSEFPETVYTNIHHKEVL